MNPNQPPLVVNLGTAAEPDLLEWTTHSSLGRHGARIFSLFKCENSGQHVALVSCAPGASATTHVHPGLECFLVLSGRFEDDHGSYGAGDLVVYRPGSRHAWRSPEGALIYVVWGALPMPTDGVREDVDEAEIPIYLREIPYNFRHLV